MTNQIPMGTRELKLFGRKLAAIWGIFFGLLLPFAFNYPLPYWPWLISALLLLGSELKPTSLAIVHKGWFLLGDTLNKIVSPILLGVVFFGLVFPLGLIKRLTGKQKLIKQADESLETYRVKPIRSPRLEDPF